MAAIHGTPKAEKLKATAEDDVVSKQGSADRAYGGAGNDSLYAGGGSDAAYGGSGNDLLVGDTTGEMVFKTDLLTMAESRTVKVTFDSEEVGCRNTLECCKIDPKTGAMTDVKIMFENASLKGSGGDLIGGESSFGFDVQAGEKIGFFLIGNGASSNNFAKLDTETYKFIDAKGNPATVVSVGAKIIHVYPKGKQTTVEGPVYHTAGFGDWAKLNADGIEHTMGYKKSNDGAFQIGSEDLWKGGDRDFDDAIFTVDISEASVEVLNKHYDTVLKTATAGVKINDRSLMQVETSNDRLQGGTGADTLQGMQGNDLLAGNGAGTEWKLVNGQWLYNPSAVKKGTGYVPHKSDDDIQGGIGNDVLLRGAGNDTLNADVGDDIAMGGAGNDTLNLELGNDFGEGGDGNDVINAGAGHDVAYGGGSYDSLRGDLGNNKLFGGVGKNELNGGVGDDFLDGGEGDDKLFGGNGRNNLVGSAGADTLDGGAGDESLSRGDRDYWMIADEGNDVLSVGTGKQAIVGGKGSDLVDRGKGDDELWGGSWTADGARDVFAHAPGGGRDIVQDFEVKLDQIDLSAYGLSFDDLASRIVDKGWATEIDLSGFAGASAGDALVLKSIKASDLTEEKFIL